MLNKRYYSLTDYYEKKYGTKVAKIALNLGLTCPNRDGKKGYGGCIFCSESLSGEFAGNKDDEIKKQFEDVKSVIIKKWPNANFIAYLQAGSNTYADIDTLKKLYAPILDLDIVGLNIATRSDCFNASIYEYLESLNKKINVTVELGLQSAKEETSKLINRKETLEEIRLAVKELRKRNIDVLIHIINGLPYETKEDMLNTIRFVNQLDIQGLKIHSLLVLKNTPLANLYNKQHFKILSLDEYSDIVVSQLEILNPNVVIYRLGADSKIDDLIEPIWTRKKLVVMNEIDKLLRKKDTYQGIYYKSHE